nr:MAG TPA_asm: portal protein [Caudoviricetes sp.]
MQAAPAEEAGTVWKKPIDRESVLNAGQTLRRYKQGKVNLEQRIVENEQWYKMRHWEQMRDKKNAVQPTSGWLFNCIANKHADAMDNYPAPNILPREEGDKAEAEMLTAIVPVILEQNEFEQTYSDAWNYKLKSGTGVYGVFWDQTKLNGLGDIAVRRVDLLNLFWEPGVEDIQSSRNLFQVMLVDNDLLEQEYPQLAGKLGGQTGEVSQYLYDDSVDTTDKSAVVDWYYKKRSPDGRTVLHYCKYVGDEVLYATENEAELSERGWYDHGQYPFIFDPLFQVEGTPAGFGYIDVGKDSQAYIDRMNQAITQNALANASPRYFIKNDGAVNEEEFADMTKPFVHVDGNLGQDSVVPVQGKNLPEIYVAVLNNKIDELKETTGNRDISTGGTTSGVTAASAIAAMQEAGSKLSRDTSKAAYRAYRRLVLMVIELIRQFYDLPRCFRIMGRNGTERYVQYSNAGLQPQDQGGMEYGVDMGVRVPLFDIEVTAQKQSPYSKMSQNELALQFYNAGFFNPQLADQALVCLDMMDFDRKQFIMQKIERNGTMFQQIQMLQQQMLQLGAMVDARGGGGEVTAGLLNQFGMAPAAAGRAEGAEKTEALGGEEEPEPSTTKKARQRVADSTAPT